jgi:hypothetical protein
MMTRNEENTKDRSTVQAPKVWQEEEIKRITQAKNDSRINNNQRCGKDQRPKEVEELEELKGPHS